MYQASDKYKEYLKTKKAIKSEAYLRVIEDDFVIPTNDITNIILKDYCNDEGIIIGTAMSKEIEVELYNKPNYDLVGKTLEFRYRLLYDDDTTEEIPYGNYIVQTPTDVVSNDKYKIVANDYMVKFNDYLDQEEFDIPCTLWEYYTQVCDFYGVEYENQEKELPNTSFVVKREVAFEGENGRTVLSRIAELFGSFIKVNRDNKLQFYLSNETDEQIDYSCMNTNLEITQFENKINTLIIELGGGVEGENATITTATTREEQNIIRITDNPFVYTLELRELVLEELFERVKDFGYTAVKLTYMGRFYYDCGDVIEVQDVKTGEYYKTLVCNQYFEIPGTIKCTIENQALTNEEVRHEYITKTQQVNKKTELVVDRLDGTITAMAETVDDHETRLAQVTMSSDRINSRVSRLVDLTTVVEGYGTLELAQCVEGELAYFYIRGPAFCQLTPNETMVPSKKLYPYGNDYPVISINHITEEIDKYTGEVIRHNELKTAYYMDPNVGEELRRLPGTKVYDTLAYDAQLDKKPEDREPKWTLTRRVGVRDDGTLYELVQPIVTKFDRNTLLLTEGLNVITLSKKSEDTYMRAIYVNQNDLTHLFTTQVEFESTIEQLPNQIMLKVLEKTLNREDVESSIDLGILDDKGYIAFKTNMMTIDSDTFKLDKTGKVSITSTEKYYQYSMLDYYLAMAYIQGKITLPSDLITLYDYDGDGQVSTADTVAIENVARGRTQSTKVVNTRLSIDPSKPENVLSIVCDYNNLMTKIGLLQMYTYMLKSQMIFVGDGYADKVSDVEYGIRLDGKNKSISVTNASSRVGTVINPGNIVTGNVQCGYEYGSFNTSGYAMMGITTAHHFSLDWVDGTSEQFWKFVVDGTEHPIPYTHTDKEQKILRFYRHGNQLVFRLDFYENVQASADIVVVPDSFSDVRLKENIKPTNVNGIDFINKIDIIQFDWKSNQEHENIGFKAQNLYELDEELAQTDSDGWYHTNAKGLIPYLTKATQELSQENKELKERVSSLEERLAKLEKMMEEK